MTPVVVHAALEHRTALERELRAAVLASGDAALLRRWVNSDWGCDDADIWRALATVRQPSRT